MKTFFMIKPDGVKRNLIGEIISRVEAKGFVISKLKMMQIDKELAEEHYKEMLLLISKYSFFNIFVIKDDEFYQQEKVKNLTDYLDLIKKNYAVVPLDYFDKNMNSSILLGSLYLIGEYKKRNKL